jgi:MFS family permease
MLPSIGRSLNIPASRQQWITSAYNVAFGCVLLVWGRLADILGRKKIFLIGSSMVSIFTLVIPFTQSEIAFDVLRAFQGAAGAATVPSTVGILGSTFPEGKQRTYAFITYTAASSLGSVFGNIIGGIIGSFLTWKWTFWLIAIFAAFVTVMAAFSVPGTLPEARKRVYVDVFGAILISSSLVLVLVALSEGNTVGWRVPWIIVILVLSIMLLAAFILWQRYLEHQTSRAPLIKTSMFKDMQLSAALVVVGLFFASYNSYLVFTTLL